ncbi:MAG: hypothetical protein NVSMB49_18590 [Ktedonobacteraceae bacterium]
MIVRIGLASFVLLASLAIGWSLLQHQPDRAHAAASITRASTATNPWGLALDTAGHIWVAEPGCDASPVCSAPPPGTIGEYATATNTKIVDFKASGAYNPVFLVPDTKGNIWFTDPTHNALGELVPGTGVWTEYPVPTANTIPYDLVMSGGNIWFTEFGTSKIGFFNITTHTFVENAIPTATANPYGITSAANGAIWFTENNANNAGKIGSFTPTANGTLTTIKEYAITNKAPHLITSDKLGNIWFSEGFGGRVGEYTTAGKDIEYPVALGVCAAAPAPCSGVHISGIAVDSNNHVWFDDSLSNRVGYLNPADGTYVAISMVAPGDSSPHTHDGLIVDANNNVWVSEQNGFNLDELPPGSVTGAPYNTPPGPIAKTWYFAEGRVGKGFREYLTVDNPSTTACSVDITYYYTADGSTTQQTKKISNVVIGSVSRLTESANSDIGLADYAPTGDSVASVVTMNAASTCAGVMVERPVYFTNYHGISSGTDVAGSTTLGKSFSFADVASDATHISYLTILNPPGGTNATVAVTYYAGGKAVGTQNTVVPAGGRGTIAPGAISLPSHSLAVVTSTTPVMVERPTYFLNESKGVSGAYDVVGAPAPAADWFFAEGYTGSTTQENLTISNPGTTSATANVTLKSQSGATKAFAVIVGAKSQVIWNVNQNNVFTGSTPEVSAEVQSSTALVVQREMFFQYSHSVQGMPTVNANGGTDVLGLVGPISKSSYSFAEGYTHPGYNEWLTLQNPNATAETVDVTLSTQDGRIAAVQVNVPANGRQTEDITADSVKYFNPGGSTTTNAISMTVQTLNNGGTFVAERPEYYNTTGTSFFVQGGTDIIGFGG